MLLRGSIHCKCQAAGASWDSHPGCPSCPLVLWGCWWGGITAEEQKPAKGLRPRAAFTSHSWLCPPGQGFVAEMPSVLCSLLSLSELRQLLIFLASSALSGLLPSGEPGDREVPSFPWCRWAVPLYSPNPLLQVQDAQGNIYSLKMQ